MEHARRGSPPANERFFARELLRELLRELFGSLRFPTRNVRCEAPQSPAEFILRSR